jgi:hypothetical protein
MAIAMALASTARPASCPPMSRGSSGTIADAVTTRVTRFFAGGKPRLLLALGVGVRPGAGEMVGNRPTGLPTPVPVPTPAAGGSETGGSVIVDGGGEVVPTDVCLALVTTIDPDPVKECVAVPEAVAVSWTCSPLVAALPTAAVACSSSAWPGGRVPMPQAAEPELGQTVKCGAPTCLTCATWMPTVTDLLVPLVLQTQMAKPASCPGRTCDEAASD